MNTRICDCFSAFTRIPASRDARPEKRGAPLAWGISWLLIASSGALAQAPASPGASSAAAAGISISPKNGQSPQQQAADRDACATWAHGQSGFDPAAPAGAASAGQHSAHLGEYQRAISACLDARGYGVSIAAAATAVPGTPPPVIVTSPGPQLNYHPFEVHIDGGYTVTTGPTNDLLDGGANAGLGFTWFPTSRLPLGVRVDGSYSWFGARNGLLADSGNYSDGHAHTYGGDVDLQLDLAHRSNRQKLYLLGGIGRYREQLELQQYSLAPGFICGWYYCWPGYVPVLTGERNTTSAWQKSWNAGIGWEIAVAPRTAFFIEGRFQSILPKNDDPNTYSSHPLHFLPIRLGLRF
jgi:hypothetical protein